MSQKPRWIRGTTKVFRDQYQFGTVVASTRERYWNKIDIRPLQVFPLEAAPVPVLLLALNLSIRPCFFLKVLRVPLEPGSEEG